MVCTYMFIIWGKHMDLKKKCLWNIDHAKKLPSIFLNIFRRLKLWMTVDICGYNSKYKLNNVGLIYK
jgi:hypothetical protein